MKRKLPISVQPINAWLDLCNIKKLGRYVYVIAYFNLEGKLLKLWVVGPEGVDWDKKDFE